MLSASIIWGFNNKGINNENGRERIKEKDK
jgi:hypothetical protein